MKTQNNSTSQEKRCIFKKTPNLSSKLLLSMEQLFFSAEVALCRATQFLGKATPKNIFYIEQLQGLLSLFFMTYHFWIVACEKSQTTKEIMHFFSWQKQNWTRIQIILVLLFLSNFIFTTSRKSISNVNELFIT